MQVGISLIWPACRDAGDRAAAAHPWALDTLYTMAGTAGAIIGAGTVRHPKMLDEVIDVGAQSIVSPVLTRFKFFPAEASGSAEGAERDVSRAAVLPDRGNLARQCRLVARARRSDFASVEHGSPGLPIMTLPRSARARAAAAGDVWVFVRQPTRQTASPSASALGPRNWLSETAARVGRYSPRAETILALP